MRQVWQSKFLENDRIYDRLLLFLFLAGLMIFSGSLLLSGTGNLHEGPLRFFALCFMMICALPFVFMFLFGQSTIVFAPINTFLVGMAIMIFNEIYSSHQLYTDKFPLEQLGFQTQCFAAFVLVFIFMQLIPSLRTWLSNKQSGTNKSSVFAEFLQYSLPIPWFLPLLTFFPLEIVKLQTLNWNIEAYFIEPFLMRAGALAFLRGNLGDSGSIFILPFQFLSVLTIPTTILACLNPRLKLKFKILVSIPAFWVVLLSFLSGTRSAFLAPVLTVGLFSMTLGRKIRSRFLPHFLVLGAVVFLGIFTQSFLRNYGLLMSSDQLQDLLTKITDAENLEDVGNDLVSLYMSSIEFATERGPLLGKSFLYYIFHPVPRFLWPEKPLHFDHYVAFWLGLNPTGEFTLDAAPTLTISTLIFGEFYGNFMGYGILFCGLFLLAYTILVAKIFPPSPKTPVTSAIWALAVSGSFNLVRSIFSLTELTYSTIILLLTLTLLALTNSYKVSGNKLGELVKRRLSRLID